jgi:methionine synthase / methylenetetrahydrofolate reductase(NADPH)
MGRIPFIERLEQGTILADGAMGTLLHGKGVAIDSCFDELNLSRPAIVFDIHRTYLEAGAEIVETNTFGANRFKLAEHGLDDRVTDINKAGVMLARQAVDATFKPNRYVAGSLGPLGVRLAPFGRVSAKQAYEAFREQIAGLCGADVLMIETMSDVVEIQEAVRAARDVCPDLPIIAEMTFTRDDRTLLGDTPEQAAEFLKELGVAVVGVNCSNGPAQIMRVIKAMQTVAPDLRYSALPNAGWPEYIGGRVMYAASAGYFADYALALRGQGVTIIGGCCGTTPDHIAAMRAALDDPGRITTLVSVDPEMEVNEEHGEQAAPGLLAQKLARSEFLIAVEVSPPKGIATEKVLRAAEMLRTAGVDLLNVADTPMARMRMSPWAISYLLQNQSKMETVLHFPTRGRNLLRIQGDLLAAHALGVRNLFVVMGDPTHIGDYPEAADNYDIVPSGLVHLIKMNLNGGIDSAGNKIGQPTNFVVSCAVNLCAPDLAREVAVTRRKVENGADYLISQPIFDLEAYERFVDTYEAAHGTLKTPIMVGLMPLYGARHATFLHNEVPGVSIPDAIMKRIEAAGDDGPQEGVRIAQELAHQLRQAATGLYLMPQFGRYDLVAEIAESIRQPVT